MVKTTTTKEKSNTSNTKGKRYIEGIGRRKEAVARVRITAGTGKFIVNDKSYDEYFVLPALQKQARAALELTKQLSKWDVSVHVSGGGKSSQAESVRLGSARALILHDEELRDELKDAGFLKRDARVVERKKFGLKKARKSPQWSKR